jgi:uncharacterized protein
MAVKGRCAAINFKEKQVLTLLPHAYGVYRLDSGSAIDFPEDPAGGFISVTRTAEELSVVCREELVPQDCAQEKGFRLFKVEGPLDFSLTGILATLLHPLAAAGIAVFTISTYDTDYLMVKAGKLDEAISALSAVAIINR